MPNPANIIWIVIKKWVRDIRPVEKAFYVSRHIHYYKDHIVIHHVKAIGKDVWRSRKTTVYFTDPDLFNKIEDKFKGMQI